MDINALFQSAGLSLTLSKLQEELFSRYYGILIEENNKYNLTAVTEKNDVYVKHFLDSVMPYQFIPQNANLLDVGSGAGFPAVPLLIVRPDIKITMIDSVNKKVTFLKYLLGELKLAGSALHVRIEDFKEGREKFDIVTSRAVAQLATLSEYCVPYLKIGGKMLAYKTDIHEADNISGALKKLGGGKLKTHDLSYLEFSRIVFEIEKISNTPSQYPRSGNKPRLAPL